MSDEHKKLALPWRVHLVNETLVIDADGQPVCRAHGNYDNDWERMAAVAQHIADRSAPPAEGMTRAPRAEFLALAEKCGANLTGKPDGSEPVTVVFSIEAWRAFDAAMQGGAHESL